MQANNSEGVHQQEKRRRNAGSGDLPQGGDQPADLFQLEKYAGLLPNEMKRLKQFEHENARLKKIAADLTLDREMLQDVIGRKL